MILMQSRRVRTLTLGIAVATFAAAISAPAVGQDEEKVEYLQELKTCQGKSTDDARLACFDEAVAKLLQASNEGNLQVVDRAEVRETRRKFFGLAMPDFGIFKKRDENDNEELEALQSVITGATRTRDGWVIETAEGAFWSIDNAPARLLDPKAGQSVEFRKAALGSYFIRINNQLGVKGRRVQ